MVDEETSTAFQQHGDDLAREACPAAYTAFLAQARTSSITHVG